MALTPVKLKPGIVTVATPTLNEAGFSAAENVRFFGGLPQKDGGFIRFANIPAGPPRAIKAWISLSGTPYLAIGTTSGLFVIVSGGAHDIAPLGPLGPAKLLPISISVMVGSNLFTINDATNSPAVNSFLQIRDPISVGGAILYGLYQVKSAIPGVSYTIQGQQNATATVANGGTARTLETVAGGSEVIVFFPNHGLSVGNVVQFLDQILISNLAILGSYIVLEGDANIYGFEAGAFADSGVMVTENNNHISISFVTATSGWGSFSAPNAHLDNWGEFLLACPWNGPIFVWMPSQGTGTPAAIIPTAPQQNSIMFVASQQQMVVVFGTIDRLLGTFDPMLVRWSDVSDYTNWIPTATDQAGSFRLTIGSERRAALALPGRNLLWTDLALYSMQYISFPLVWGFQPLGINCGADGPHAVGILDGLVYWKNRNQFMVLTPNGPETLQCPVWDDVFLNQDLANLGYVVCETNAFFGEVGWSVPQKGGSFVFVRLRVVPGDPAPIWTVSAYHHHTAWIDQNVFGAPIGGHEDGLIDQHDTGVDAMGAALPTSLTTGRIKIAEGDQITAVRGIYPDIKWLNAGTLNIQASFYDDPDGTPRVTDSYPITPGTEFVPLRGRGRDVQFTLSGNDIGSNWRLGLFRYYGSPDGRR